MGSTGTSVQYQMVAESLKVYGGGGAAQRWELTYSLLPTNGQESEYKAGKRTRPNRPNGRDLPRELPRHQKRAKRNSLRSEEWQLHQQPERLRNPTLNCEEELSEGDSESEGGRIGSSNGDHRKRTAVQLPDTWEYDPSIFEETDATAYLVHSDNLHELLQGYTELGSVFDADNPWEQQHGQNIPSETTFTYSTLHPPHGQASAANKNKGKGRTHI